MISQLAYAPIAALDLSSIRTRLMHPHAGLGWSETRTRAAERDYRQFLLLAKTTPAAEASPTADVDAFWHFHILDTVKYARDCSTVFGYFLHHKPDPDPDGADAIARHRRLRASVRSRTRQADAAAPTSKSAAYCAIAATAPAAYCAIVATAPAAYCAIAAAPAQAGQSAHRNCIGERLALQAAAAAAPTAYCAFTNLGAASYCAAKAPSKDIGSKRHARIVRGGARVPPPHC